MVQKNHLWEDLKMTLLNVYYLFFKSVEIESVLVSAHPLIRENNADIAEINEYKGHFSLGTYLT